MYDSTAVVLFNHIEESLDNIELNYFNAIETLKEKNPVKTLLELQSIFEEIKKIKSTIHEFKMKTIWKRE